MAEKEYIEREMALKRIDHAISEYARHGEIVRFIGDCRSSIIYAPADDVVEVVRCKNCALHEQGCPLDTHPYMTPDDGFCFLGKRKE